MYIALPVLRCVARAQLFFLFGRRRETGVGADRQSGVGIRACRPIFTRCARIVNSQLSSRKSW